MFRMYASNSHSYTHLILALGIVREPTIWGFITSKYPGIHDIGLAINGVATPWFELKQIQPARATLLQNAPALPAKPCRRCFWYDENHFGGIALHFRLVKLQAKNKIAGRSMHIKA